MNQRIPANVRAAQLDKLTRVRLAKLAGVEGSKRYKYSLISERLRDKGYSEDEIENRGPITLTNLFPLG